MFNKKSKKSKYQINDKIRFKTEQHHTLIGKIVDVKYTFLHGFEYLVLSDYLFGQDWYDIKESEIIQIIKEGK